MDFSSSSDPLGVGMFLETYSHDEDRIHRMALGSHPSSPLAAAVNQAGSLAEIHSHMLFPPYPSPSVGSCPTPTTSSIVTQIFTNPSAPSTALSDFSSSAAPSIHFPLPEPVGPDPNGGPPLLFCEFVGLTGCDVSFRRHDLWPWVQHIEEEHLRGRLPESCKCWFCDDAKFKAAQNNDDRQTTFRQRMEHIHRHIINDGYTVEHMRPDFDILKHLYWHNLVDEAVYRWARQYEEGPTTTGTYAHDFIPPEQVEATQRDQRLEWRETREERNERRAHRRRDRPSSRRSGPGPRHG